MSEIPNLMPHQQEPFNADVNVCAEFLKLKEKFNITTAIETGSCLYSTSKWLGDNFGNVYTVEVNEDFAKHGRYKVADMPNVHSSIDDSVRWLNGIINFNIKQDEKCLYFGDAHWNDSCPLLGELQALSSLQTLQKPVIVIHDFKVPNEPNLGYDDIHGQAFEYDWIKPYLENIYGADGYDYYYNSDATSTDIKRGLIYITPKVYGSGGDESKNCTSSEGEQTTLPQNDNALTEGICIGVTTPDDSNVVKEDMICPATKEHCDDEVCTVGSECNVAGSKAEQITSPLSGFKWATSAYAEDGSSNVKMEADTIDLSKGLSINNQATHEFGIKRELKENINTASAVSGGYTNTIAGDGTYSHVEGISSVAESYPESSVCIGTENTIKDLYSWQPVNKNWLNELPAITVWKKYSQANEESYLDHILKNIRPINKMILEFGSWDGYHLSNVRYFMEQGYKALLIDGDNHGNSEVKQHFVTRENVLSILEQYDMPKEFDLLCLDLDGCDIYIFDEILSKYKPSVIIAEFNPIFSEQQSFTIAYNPEHTWNNDDFYGFSFAAGVKMGKKNGYTCIFQNDNLNMYFVENNILAESLGISVEEIAQLPKVTYSVTNYHPKSVKNDWVIY